MASTSTLTPTLRRGSNLSVCSPSTPIDFLSPTSQLRRTRPVVLSTQVGTLAENDDATEKQQRQKSRVNAFVLQSPASMTPKSAGRINSVEGSALTVNGRTKLTNIQLKDLYSNCLKLSTENKINSKNAFGLQLIDYMQEFLTNVDKDQGVTNFQIASCTLDAGAKIYAGRVDSIHAQAYKMLGGLGRAENANEDAGGEIDSDGDRHDDNENVSKKKKARKSKIIESNLNNINTDQFNMQFEVDQLFQKLAATFDEGCTSSLLLNHLGCRDDFCETLFDSKTVPTSTLADFDCGNSQTVCVSDIRDMRMRILSSSVQICPQYDDFSFTSWDLNVENAREKEISVDQNNEDAFDMDAPGPATFGPVNEMPDTDGGGFDDDDGDVGGFDDGPAGVNTDTSANSLGFADGQEAQLFLPGQSRSNGTAVGNATDLGTFMLSLQSSENINEYSYSALPIWAGPAQWKNRAQFDALKGLNKGNTKRKTTTRKKMFRIDFDATHDFDKLFSKGKAATVLAKTTMDKHASNQKTLPDDLHFEFSHIMKLFLKTKLMVRRQYGVQPTVTDDGSGNNWYNYENENDCANYCPADTQDDDDDDVFEGEQVEGFNEDSSQEMSQTLSSFNNETVFQGDNLVAQPNKVQKIDIVYSKTAKKIDVKKVKRAMWDIMSSISCDADKENMPENHPVEAVVKETVVKETVTKPCNFTELYHTIPNKISKQMAKNLSFPIAFVCLLHLANEKNLQLQGYQSMDDFTITQGI